MRRVCGSAGDAETNVAASPALTHTLPSTRSLPFHTKEWTSSARCLSQPGHFPKLSQPSLYDDIIYHLCDNVFCYLRTFFLVRPLIGPWVRVQRGRAQSCWVSWDRRKDKLSCGIPSRVNLSLHASRPKSLWKWWWYFSAGWMRSTIRIIRILPCA